MPNFVDTLGFIGGDVGSPHEDWVTLGRIRKARESGLGVVHVTASWPMESGMETMRQTMESAALIQRHPDTFALIRNISDLDKTLGSNKLGVILGLQNAEPLNMPRKCAKDLKHLFEHGVRVMQLGYQGANGYAGGFMASAYDRLTDNGRTLVTAIEDAGMIVDLSHLNCTSVGDALQATRRAPWVSHTTCRSIYDHPRGSIDVNIRGVAEKGGVVGILAMTFFLNKTTDGPEAFVAHVRHAVQVAGAESICIGSDGPVSGFMDLAVAEMEFKTTQKYMDPEGALGSRWPTHVPAFFGEGPHVHEHIRRALEPHFKASELDGIMGDNALRFLRTALPQT